MRCLANSGRPGCGQGAFTQLVLTGRGGPFTGGRTTWLFATLGRMSEPIQPVDGADPKSRLRRSALRNRASLSVDHRRICVGLRRFLDAEDLSGWIVVFDAMPGEPDVGCLFDDEPRRRLALTRTPETGRILTIHDGRGPREAHRFGYTQPTADAAALSDDDIAAVLVPGLAFDRFGGRLGFGAGFYDRFLARLQPDVLRIGVSDGFIVDRVPTDDHDVVMTHLASEAGVMSVPLESMSIEEPRLG